jgi:hypothetical protein
VQAIRGLHLVTMPLTPLQFIGVAGGLSLITTTYCLAHGLVAKDGVCLPLSLASLAVLRAAGDLSNFAAARSCTSVASSSTTRALSSQSPRLRPRSSQPRSVRPSALDRESPRR